MSSIIKRRYKKTEKDLQLLVLQVMQQKKETLFGQFSSDLTKPDIQNEWAQVASLAASYGLIRDEDGEKFRRITWQNWRRTSMNKINKMKTTGMGGASLHDLLDENDKIVLDIIGKEVAFGVGTEESSGDGTPMNTGTPSSSLEVQPQQKEQQPRKRKESDTANELFYLKKKLLEVTVYQRQLECLQLEKNLGLPASRHTADVYNSKID